MQLLFLIGIPGSGKTTYSQRYIDAGYKIHSSDAIREEISKNKKIKYLKENNISFDPKTIKGDPNDQSVSFIAFKEMYKRTALDLLNGKNVIFDSCLTNKRSRKTAIKEIFKLLPENFDVDVIGIVFDKDLEKCKERNKKRESEGSQVIDYDGTKRTVSRIVPEEVLDRMYKNLYENFPSTDEGFDSIEIIKEDEMQLDKEK